MLHQCLKRNRTIFLRGCVLNEHMPIVGRNALAAAPIESPVIFYARHTRDSSGASKLLNDLRCVHPQMLLAFSQSVNANSDGHKCQESKGAFGRTII